MRAPHVTDTSAGRWCVSLWSSRSSVRPELVVVEEPDPHPARGRRMLAAHPELRALFGREPRTAALGAGLAALQLGIAAALGLGGAPWWLGLILAWAVGAFVAHALFAV